MAKTLFEKMYMKPTCKAAMVHVPSSLAAELAREDTATALSDVYDFILAFYIKREDLEKEMQKIKTSLSEKGLLWIAYPKGKALGTDINRDILRELLQKQNLDSVSIISLDDTWSAMRFKKYNERQTN